MTATPGQADMAALVRAAQAADYVGRPVDRNWTRVSDAQAARLIGGALAMALAAREPHAADAEAPPEVQFAPCPVEGHDGRHMQWRSGQWTCGHVLANSLILGGVLEQYDREQVRLAREDRDAVRGRMLALAARLEESAAQTEPSRKSEIEREAAIHIRQALDL